MPHDPNESRKLRFGPYQPPAVSIGDEVQCEVRGLVTVADWSDRGPIMWPRCKTSRRRALILTGDLVRACGSETLAAVAAHWGVNHTLVKEWKRALGAPRFTPGSLVILSATSSERRAGTPVAPQTRAALLRAAKRPRGKAWRQKIGLSVKLASLVSGKIMTTVDAERTSEMILMRLAGQTYSAIGQRFGMTKQAVAQAFERLTTRKQVVVEHGAFICPRCDCGLYARSYADKIGHHCDRGQIHAT